MLWWRATPAVSFSVSIPPISIVVLPRRGRTGLRGMPTVMSCRWWRGSRRRQGLIVSQRSCQVAAQSSTSFLDQVTWCRAARFEFVAQFENLDFDFAQLLPCIFVFHCLLLLLLFLGVIFESAGIQGSARIDFVVTLVGVASSCISKPINALSVLIMTKFIHTFL